MGSEIMEEKADTVQGGISDATNKVKNIFSDMDKITIILHEYDKLSKEIDTRTSNGYQLAAVFATVAIWMVSQQNFDMRFWFTFASALVISFLSIAYIFININKAAVRLKQIEKDINERTGGESLLIWESKHGRAETGYFKL